MSDSAVIFLDVDGVISPLTNPPAEDAWGDWVELPGVGFDTPVSKAMADALAALPAERVWLTTWGHDANVYLTEPFGWAHLPVAERDDAGDATRTGWWKLDAALDWVDTHPEVTAVVWLDDELVEHQHVARREFHARQLAVWLHSPRSTTGITPDVVDQIADWLDIEE